MSVTVYSSSTCGPCKMLKKDLLINGIHFNTVDIHSSGNIDELKIRSVPTTIVEHNGEMFQLVGYSKETVKEIQAIVGEK